MKSDLRHQLLIQIEMLRGEISHSQLSERLGDITERALARYVAGKSYLIEKEFRQVAKALGMDAEKLAYAWAASLRVRISDEDIVSEILSRARLRWRQHARIAKRAVPSHPSHMAVIRAKYADRLPRRTPPLWFGSSYSPTRAEDTPQNRARFARGYEMLIESVHGRLSARDIGALRGISGERARQLMVGAAYAWAQREKVDLSGKTVPFRNEARLVRNLYAALSFFGQQQFTHITHEVETRRRTGKGGRTS